MKLSVSSQGKATLFAYHISYTVAIQSALNKNGQRKKTILKKVQIENNKLIKNETKGIY